MSDPRAVLILMTAIRWIIAFAGVLFVAWWLWTATHDAFSIDMQAM